MKSAPALTEYPDVEPKKPAAQGDGEADPVGQYDPAGLRHEADECAVVSQRTGRRADVLTRWSETPTSTLQGSNIPRCTDPSCNERVRGQRNVTVSVLRRSDYASPGLDRKTCRRAVVALQYVVE